MHEVYDIQRCISNKIQEFYIFENINSFDKTQELLERTIKIAEILQEYWESLLKNFDSKTIKDNNFIDKIVEKFPKIDQKFISALIHTQMFVNTLD